MQSPNKEIELVTTILQFQWEGRIFLSQQGLLINTTIVNNYSPKWR